MHNQETSVDNVMHDALLAAAGAVMKTLPGLNGRWYKSSRAVRPRCNKTEMSASVPQNTLPVALLPATVSPFTSLWWQLIFQK